MVTGHTALAQTPFYAKEFGGKKFKKPTSNTVMYIDVISLDNLCMICTKTEYFSSAKLDLGVSHVSFTTVVEK